MTWVSYDPEHGMVRTRLIPQDACCHLHPDGGRRCQLAHSHDELAHSWERYDEEGRVVESYEWLGDDTR